MQNYTVDSLQLEHARGIEIQFELWRVQIIERNYRENLTEETEKSVRVMEVLNNRE